MLPTPDAGIPKRQVVILESVTTTETDSHAFVSNPSPTVSVISLNAESVDAETLNSVDAYILRLHADLGLSTEAISLWQSAQDHSIPRSLIVTQAVNGRADFDEMVAIIQRVLEPDALVRYLPIETDDETAIAGAYDVLTNEIIQSDNGALIRTPADPEHLEITASRRSELLDELTYAFENEETFTSHVQGLPISMSELSMTFLSNNCVPIFFDDVCMATAINEWLLSRTSHWQPILKNLDLTFSVDEVNESIGIGIGSGIVRMFGPPLAETTDAVRIDSQSLVQELKLISNHPGVVLAHQVARGDTVRPIDSGLIAYLPEF